MAERLTIGKLAKASGVRIDTVRFYERKGLISRGAKKLTHFKEYRDEDAKRFRFIKRAQDLGFTLAEIRDLLELRMNSRATCAQVNAKTLEKLQEIDRKIDDLKRIRKTLSRALTQCSNDNAPTTACPILGAFERADLSS